MAEADDDESKGSPVRFTKLPVPSPENADEIFRKEDFPDKSLFDATVHHPAVSVPLKKTGSIRKLLKKLLAKGVKNTNLDVCNADRRIIVLKPGTTQSEIDAAMITTAAADKDETDQQDLLQWIPEFPVTRTYQDQSAEELLRKLLPAGFEIPSSFEKVGPLAHVNIREQCHPYKYWIGQILLDRTAAVQIVVNKVGTIDSVYRTFDMEILAGDASDKDWSVVTVHEHGSTFQLDYQHVYWNSRLSGEHTRLVDLILNEQRNTLDRSLVVVDLMAGVGPFAVPLTRPRSAKREDGIPPPPPVIVYANDLNPVSFQYLKINAQTNKCKNLHCSNEDARAFLRRLQHPPENSHNCACDQQVVVVPYIDHVIMNLPASAPEFLDAFRGWSLNLSLPTVHVHCFAPKRTVSADALLPDSDSPQQQQHCSNSNNSNNNNYPEAVARCERAMGCSLDPSTVQIHVVRNVSPSNNMLCISFPLPHAVVTLLDNRSIATTTSDNIIINTTDAATENVQVAAANDEPEPKRAKKEPIAKSPPVV